MNVQEWLGEDNKLGIDIWNNKYRYENETFDEWLDRVSDGYEDLKKLIIEKKFLFGGRTLANYNTFNTSSTSNCYSSGYAPDDTDGILELNKNIGMTYKSQGGQGISLSKIRPKGSKISKGYTTDGIIPFMEIFNTTTTSISQGGSRKGALMLSLDAWHKEAYDFITIKSEQGRIEKANLSLEVDDEFMNCVKKYYETGKEITVSRVFKYDSGEIEYEVTPIKLYKKMCEICHEWAEPAFIFTNRFRNYNMMQYVNDYEIITGNPCGEQPLPKNGACNLGSINLSEFVINPYTDKANFDYAGFIKATKVAIKGLDKVIDYGYKYHALKEQQEMAYNYRNIGLGIMGYGSMLFKLGIKYGSEESIQIIDKILDNMFRASVMESNKLATELGTFPKYEDSVLDADIIKDHFTKEEIEVLREDGLRNCSLLSIAPSGSIGTMLNITTGCEPAFRISYTRKTESLHKDKDVYYEVFINEAKEYKKLNRTNTLPDYFIGSDKVKWENRVEIQATMQRHVDTAISSTVNLPNETTIPQVEKLYIYAWELGIKGITIYRDGCSRGAILTTNDSTKQEPIIDETTLEWGTVLQVDNDCIGKKRKLQTGCGSLHVTAFFDKISGRLLECYLSKGSTGGCNQFMVGLSRMISLSARAGVGIDNIIDQLNSTGTCPSYAVRKATKHDTSTGNCCPMAVGYALKDMYNEICEELGLNDEEENENEVKVETKSDEPKCPICGEPIKFEGGCQSCTNPDCYWTKCE